MGTIVVPEVRGYSTAGTIVVPRVRGYTQTSAQIVVPRVRGWASDVAVTLGEPQTVDPYVVVLVAAATTDPDMTQPDDWALTFDAANPLPVRPTGVGPAVVFDPGSGPLRTYLAPDTRVQLVLRINLVATLPGGATVTATVLHTIRAYPGPWKPLGGTAWSGTSGL
jgi:hypothetical protein